MLQGAEPFLLVNAVLGTVYQKTIPLVQELLIAREYKVVFLQPPIIQMQFRAAKQKSSQDSRTYIRSRTANYTK